MTEYGYDQEIKAISIHTFNIPEPCRRTTGVQQPNNLLAFKPIFYFNWHYTHFSKCVNALILLEPVFDEPQLQDYSNVLYSQHYTAVASIIFQQENNVF